MLRIIFVTPSNSIVFSATDMESVDQTLAEFNAGIESLKSGAEKFLFARDERGKPVGMVRVSQVIGYFLHDSTEPGEEWRKR